MKRFYCVLFLVILTLGSPATCFAESKAAKVYSENVILEETVNFASVKITDNPGIMGFKITLDYTSELIKITDITAGSLTSQGSFMDNLGVKKSSVDIIWYSTEQVTGDGTLFVIAIKPLKAFDYNENAQIGISYSQEDTFNEKYEDVSLDCSAVSVFPDTSYDAENSGQNQTLGAENKAENEVTDSQIIAAVDTALENSGVESVDQADENTLLLANENLRVITDSDSYRFPSVEDMKKTYKDSVKNNYAEQLELSIEPEALSEIYADALNEFGAQSPAELSPEDNSEFVREISQKLNETDSKLSDLSNLLSDEELYDLYAEIYSRLVNVEFEEESEEINVSLIVITCFIIIALVIAALIAFRLKKQKSNQSAPTISE